MSYLLDTHIFIWWMEQNKRLPQSTYQILNDPQKQVFLSVASIWEVLIKQSKKKIKLPVDINAGIKHSNFQVLPIGFSHVLRLQKLPLVHQDPFDRILVAQAQFEKMTLITVDPKIKQYDIKTLS